MLDHLDQLAFVFKAFRKAKGMSQDDLAHAAGGGVNRTVVALLEQGRRTPSPAALEAIASSKP
jgi:transcriptional regulator with XRE-family HTH domain